MSRVKRRISWLLAVVVLVGAAALFGGPRLLAAHRLRQARADLAAGRCAAARHKLERCLAVWPDDPETLRLAAQAARRTGDFAAADAWLHRCQKLEVEPSPASVLEYSLLIAEQGDFPRVEVFLRSQVDRGHPDTELILEALTKGYLRMYRFPDAMGCLDVWQKRSPDSAQAHFLRGRGWQQVNSFGRAVESYRAAVERDPDHDDARLALANALIEEGLAAEAIPHLELLRRRRPDDPEVLVRLAFAWNSLGQANNSRAAFDELLAAHPRFTAALFGRGQLELEAERPAAAEEWFRRALAVAPHHRQANYGLYLALERQGKQAEAAARLEHLRQVEATLNRLQVVINRLMPESPNDPKLHHELGDIVAAMDEPEVAAQWYQSALRQDPDYQPAHRALAAYYERTGDVARAQQHRAQLRTP